MKILLLLPFLINYLSVSTCLCPFRLRFRRTQLKIQLHKLNRFVLKKEVWAIKWVEKLKCKEKRLKSRKDKEKGTKRLKEGSRREDRGQRKERRTA